MAYPSIKIRALQAFIAVYEEQSFSRAAERENTTQSGMSTQVKGLELVLGVPLLVRERKRFALTPAGEIIYREGQAILKALMATEKAVQEMRGAVAGLVRFGMIPSLTRSVLIPALHQFQSQFPDVELSLLEEYSFSLMRRVLDGELDFALVPSTDLPAGLTGTYVGRDCEMLVSGAAAGIGTPHLAPIPLQALSGCRLIVPSRLNVRRKHIDTLLNTHGVHLAEMLEMDGMLATLEMIGATDWVAILPSAICHPDKAGTVRRLNPIKDPPISLDYVLVEKAEMAAPRAARLLADCLVAHVAVILADWDDLPIADPERHYQKP
ncbi:LysR family transcriptional regulator [Loktanella fryxellensis]|uniref:LysR family transcriptional regulator n=1 Tax=Loktanella fryxellensis TaxID=245187 RepID=UPI0015A5B968|nr:LysR family transcriptional regulator [Loktanella fryxellensis]